MSKMLKSSGAMAAATLLSRVLGMVRVMVYARFMGDGLVAGAGHAVRCVDSNASGVYVAWK